MPRREAGIAEEVTARVSRYILDGSDDVHGSAGEQIAEYLSLVGMKTADQRTRRSSSSGRQVTSCARVARGAAVPARASVARPWAAVFIVKSVLRIEVRG